MSAQGDSYDYKHVNFSQDHELDTHLEKHDKSKSIENRNELKFLGAKLKLATGKTVLTHKEFDDYIAKKLDRLKDPVKSRQI